MAALFLFTAAITSQNEAKAIADSDAGNATVVMDKPSFGYYKSGKAVDKNNTPLKLKLKSSKANQVIDEDKWFQNNKLSLKTYQVPNQNWGVSGNLPKGIDKEWDQLIVTSAFYDASYIYCTYGSDFSEGYILNIYNAKTKKMVYSFDFSSYRYSPKYVKADYDFIQQRINWAVIKDNVLYVSHSHNTYAKSSNNQNAYITAIDLSDRSILWRTKALVSNASNFLIVDGVIICGYGFTGESDYLYQVDLSTGKVLSKTPLKSAPSYIIKKGNSFYVRTYNTDYKFDIAR
ncbi:hypothetical protein SAMN02745217_01613 [Anaerocolumna xylanovorans DSM 12503]|uniref:PQQ-like domain-containing protein n=2 Tax=Anaerocolumna TaxID=1843210 RepID=A0A1M7Y5H7_9FIRM|nr:hypothetical protein SAMN02745217_01613 [Anaerocolumna xylanovorans DSM 12503]